MRMRLRQVLRRDRTDAAERPDGILRERMPRIAQFLGAACDRVERCVLPHPQLMCDDAAFLFHGFGGELRFLHGLQ